MRTRRSACSGAVTSTPDRIDGASTAMCPSALWVSTSVPSSSHSGSIAASRTIAASCAAFATSVTHCKLPIAAAHSARDPATPEGDSTALKAATAASAEACTSPGPTVSVLTPALPSCLIRWLQT